MTAAQNNFETINQQFFKNVYTSSAKPSPLLLGVTSIVCIMNILLTIRKQETPLTNSIVIHNVWLINFIMLYMNFSSTIVFSKSLIV